MALVTFLSYFVRCDGCGCTGPDDESEYNARKGFGYDARPEGDFCGRCRKAGRNDPAPEPVISSGSFTPADEITVLPGEDGKAADGTYSLRVGSIEVSVESKGNTPDEVQAMIEEAYRVKTATGLGPYRGGAL